MHRKDLSELINNYFEYELSIDGILREMEAMAENIDELNKITAQQEGYTNPTVRLVDALLVEQQLKRERGLWWLMSCLLLVVFALSGPAWRQLPTPLYGTQRAAVFLLDVSEQSYGQDIKPARFVRAKFKIQDRCGFMFVILKVCGNQV